MTQRVRGALQCIALLCCAMRAVAAPAMGPTPAQDVRPFDFAVIGHTFPGESGDEAFKHVIVQADRTKPAFVIAAGIKAADEPCSDRLYQQRRTMLNTVERPLVVVLAGSDWADCRNSAGRSNAIERLNRIREIYFDGQESLGGGKLELKRQSTITKFRSYAENAHWERGGVLFATLNLPAKNNHYLSEAGRNSEYEDRLVANRAWLQRLFGQARRRRMEGIVLFSDGDLKAHVEQGFSLLSGFSSRQDGFAETRKLVRTLAEKFPGKVLLVDTSQGPAAEPPAKGAVPPGTLTWRGNLGHVTFTGEWHGVRVEPGSAALFSLVTQKSDADGPQPAQGERKPGERPAGTRTANGAGSRRAPAN